LIGEEQHRERERETERSREGGDKVQEERRIMPPAAAGSSAVKASTSALTRVFAVSPALKKFLGVTEISRPETMKRIWSYIKGHQLQNPQNRKEIICDEKLKAVLGKDIVGFTELAGLLSAHFPKVKKSSPAPES
jgi:chromatin remodeling complex protein RSC6